MEERSDRFTAIEDQYAGYTVVDEGGSKIGKVDDLFLDESDQPEYFGVKMGFLGTSSTLIPADIATINNEQGFIETGEFREHDRNQEGFSQPGSDLEDEDELRVQRSEEELRAGTREREAGAMKVRKRVRTDREQIEVPTKHEEVTVERVPVEGEATEAQIGEDEVSVPVTEEEVVVDKRAVAKEEIRLRKEVVEDTETVEEDVRREEIDVEDATERGSSTGL